MLDQFAAEELRENVRAEAGTDVSIALAGGGLVQLRGIYRTLSQLATLGEIVEMDGVSGQLQCSTADVAGVARGDAVTVSGSTFNVVGIEATRGGLTVLVLGI